MAKRKPTAEERYRTHMASIEHAAACYARDRVKEIIDKATHDMSAEEVLRELESDVARYRKIMDE